MNVRLIAKTVPVEDFALETGCDSSEDLISYCARVSNPSNQNNFDTSEKLLRYCIRKKHWSVFEMADAIFRIECTRDIGRQILRHRSFCYQEFSQRYAEPNLEDFVIRECRFQDATNRQSSIEVQPFNESETAIASEWSKRQHILLDHALDEYNWAIKNGIAKEQARVVLPEGMTPSVMFMKGSIRSWYHYTLIRDSNETQKEHRLIAHDIKKQLCQHFEFLNECLNSVVE